MGCLWFLLKVLFLAWVFRAVWTLLILPLFRSEEATDGACPRSGTAGGTETSRACYLRRFMPLLAKIAKCDGRVTEQEISGIELIFSELKLSPEEQRYARQVFSESKDSLLQFEDAAHAFVRAYHDFELRVLTFQFMVRVACADGDVSLRERQMLLRAAQVFGLPRILVENIFINISGRRFWFSEDSFGSGFGQQRRQSAEPSRAEDLALLGVSSSASAENIRKAYRQKVKELHPDRLQSQGLPEPMLRQATERMAAINAAYDRLAK